MKPVHMRMGHGQRPGLENNTAVNEPQASLSKQTVAEEEYEQKQGCRPEVKECLCFDCSHTVAFAWSTWGSRGGPVAGY